MPEEPRRYLFHPLERRGVILGLQPVQLAGILAGAVAAVVAGRAAPGPAGPATAILVLVLAAAAALWSREGKPIVAWVAVAAGWLTRRCRGPWLDPECIAGRRGRIPTGAGAIASRGRAPSAPRGRPPGPSRHRPARRLRSVPGLAGIELVGHAAGPGQRDLGLVRDHRSSTWAAVLPVHGRAFSLLDPADQIGCLDGWRAVLGALARPGTPLRRIQWVARSAPTGGGDLPSAPRSRQDDAAAISYGGLVAAEAPTIQAHEVWLVLAVGGPGRPGPGRDRAIDSLQREIRLLEGQLRHADLHPGPPLGPDALMHALAEAHDLEACRPASRLVRAWPAASAEDWSALHAGGSWHVTYWIAEWPRIEVGADFLSPVLLASGRQTLSVVMAPVPPERAAREVRSARTADVADEELRSRAGFLPSARRGREADGVVQREAELAEGHAEYRYSGYVTVTAASPTELAAACIDAEQRAQASHLELRRLYGRQADAFAWTLPLARGLA